MDRLILVFFSVVFIAGCASTGYNHSYYSAAYQLKLNQPITVPAGSSYVYVIAPGKVVVRNEISTYELYCKFSVPRSKDSDEMIITPDIFQIHNIYRRTSSIYHQPYAFQLAYNGGFGGLFNHHHASKQDLELFLNIHSVDQPQVKSLSCIRFADPYFGYTPTVAEMQKVFQGLAELVLTE